MSLRLLRQPTSFSSEPITALFVCRSKDCFNESIPYSVVLIPSDRNAPDPNILSLEEMSLNIGIDNGTARVAIREIFANHTNRNLEGTYSFALPIRALLSDFAVWDDLTRIPGVILERKRAEEIYDNLRVATIDPGLLQMGERSAEEASRSSEFTAKVTPIPSRGTKRVEIEY